MSLVSLLRVPLTTIMGYQLKQGHFEILTSCL